MKPNEYQSDVRRVIADVIRDALTEQPVASAEVVVVDHDDERVGPMGGHHTQILVAYDDGEEIIGLAINVYADDVIDAKLDAEIERRHRARARRDALREVT